MSRIIVPNQPQRPCAGDITMGVENGLVVIKQCMVIAQAFPPDEAERFAMGILKSVEIARQQVAALQAVVDGNGAT